MSAEELYDTNEAPVVVNEPQTPAVTKWSWTPTNLMWAALGVLGAAFLIWFVMDFSSAKNAHTHAPESGA